MNRPDPTAALDRGDLPRRFRHTIGIDRFPLSPKVKRGKELAKIDLVTAPIPRPLPFVNPGRAQHGCRKRGGDDVS
jgi:hypothetical protein